MHRVRALFAFVLLAACAQIPVGESVDPIIFGARETGYPEVVAVYWTDGSSGGGLCSGTIIGPHAVLTAKHCVYYEEGGGYTAVPAGWFYVLEGDDIGSPTAFHRVAEVRTTPGSDINADVDGGSDIAVLLVTDRFTPTPRGYATSGPSSGADVTVVGFGRTMTGTPSPTDSGLKYSGQMTVVRTFSRQIFADGSSWTCQGDSGGPLIDPSGNVAGVTSFGLDGSCRRSESFFTRVSAWTSLITDALAWAPPCVPSGEVCNGFDDDCDGTPDDGLGCAPLGTACTAPEECVTGRCEDVGGSMICTRSCFPDYPIDPCEPMTGFHCEVVECGIGRCAPGAPGAGAPGATCTTDTDCASGYCADLQGRRLCGQQCQPGISDCGLGEACNLETGTECGACVPEELAMGPRPFGTECAADVECASEMCRLPGFCTRACTTSDECPGAYHCDGISCAPGALSGQGGTCAGDGDCRESAPDCVEGACAASCTLGGADCPEGYVCADVEGPHCVRPGGGLGAVCTMNEECRSGLCGGTCSILCDTASCPAGYECRNAGTVDACFPEGSGRSGGGCACTASRPNGRGWMPVLAALALGIAARRRRSA